MKTIFAIFSLLFFTTVYFFIQEEIKKDPPVKFSLKAAPVVVVQYTAPWPGVVNYQGLEKLQGCAYIFCDLEKSPYYKTSQKIHSLPTIIVYKNGLEMKRWEGGLAMKINVPFSVIQTEVKKCQP
jgi:hypothetical protein